ncbi:PIN domain-containing protein [Niabella yanshanensis]|uniref:PIN domain-containing protein n=1 Tax=Niabella yanshanensis TaxID=577386 RepID=A0ABZ0WCK4_9BACT|nr:PIN domain-containing protein [Niabella yanshanensis]WQD40155.1 PIN domain-containing protein [Niabella yanshanensis]
MKIFVDANILVAVVNKQYPVFTYASRVLSWATANKHQLVTSAVALAITYYFAEKKHGATSAKARMVLLMQYVLIADCGNDEVVLAACDKKVKDFEDGLQYYSALNAGCSCIVTENTADFYFSSVDVLSAQNFLLKYYRK